MKILIQAKKSAADPGLKAYAQAKLEKLARHSDHILEARLELGTDKNKSLETMKVAELTVHVSGRSGTIRKAVQSAEHMHEAIDLVVDKMDRQIREHKDRLKDHRQRGTEVPTLPVAPATTDGVARVKRFKLKPIPREQARREMEALDHAFYLFLDEDSQEVNVLYRRRDGSLGLLEADLT